MLEIARQIAGSSVRIRKVNVKTLWRMRPPAKRKKRLPTAYTATDVGVSTTVGSFSPIDQKKMVLRL
jgi:hypothetical protein